MVIEELEELGLEEGGLRVGFWVAEDYLRDDSDRTVGSADVVVAGECPGVVGEDFIDQGCHAFGHQGAGGRDEVSDYSEEGEGSCSAGEVFVKVVGAGVVVCYGVGECVDVDHIAGCGGFDGVVGEVFVLHAPAVEVRGIRDVFRAAVEVFQAPFYG